MCLCYVIASRSRPCRVHCAMLSVGPLKPGAGGAVYSRGARERKRLRERESERAREQGRRQVEGEGLGAV